MVWKLQCRFVSFAGTDANDALQFSDENFAVANFSGVSRFADDIDDFIQLIVVNRHINLHFWQKVDAILGAAVELRVPYLTPKSFDLSDRQALNADGRQSFTHVFQFEWFDYHCNQLHKSPPVSIR